MCLCISFVLIALAGLTGCGDSSGGKQEYAYVSSPEAELQDRVAGFHNKTGVVHNGDKVQILERMTNRRWVRVRSPRGEEGWVPERYLTDQRTFDQLQQLAEQYKNAPVQATAVTTKEVNLHAVPGRKTEHLYQLAQNEKVDMLQRQAVDRNAPAEPTTSKGDKKGSDSEDNDQSSSKSGQPPILEDWWLIRDSQKRVGWAYGHLLYLDIPIDVAQYAEGQRIVAFFVLDQVQDEDKKVPEYLVLLTENKDGLPYDYDQVRVFSWNVRRHRYETAFRDRGISGFLPAVLGTEKFEKEGDLRTFTLHVADEAGSLHEQKYKFNPPIVRQVLAPGEAPIPKVHHKKAAKAVHKHR
ncbi:MAG TPA: SH3 domain-containing protein [Candidatus Angelobacter sp.]